MFSDDSPVRYIIIHEHSNYLAFEWTPFCPVYDYLVRSVYVILTFVSILQMNGQVNTTKNRQDPCYLSGYVFAPYICALWVNWFNSVAELCISYLVGFEFIPISCESNRNLFNILYFVMSSTSHLSRIIPLFFFLLRTVSRFCSLNRNRYSRIISVGLYSCIVTVPLIFLAKMIKPTGTCNELSNPFGPVSVGVEVTIDAFGPSMEITFLLIMLGIMVIVILLYAVTMNRACSIYMSWGVRNVQMSLWPEISLIIISSLFLVLYIIDFVYVIVHLFYPKPIRILLIARMILPEFITLMMAIVPIATRGVRRWLHRRSTRQIKPADKSIPPPPLKVPSKLANVFETNVDV